MVTWLKIQHRNLFTASRNDQTNGICRACDWELENQIHLARCRIINRDFWDKVLKLIEDLGGDIPATRSERTEYLIAGRINNTQYVKDMETGIIALAWRVLYAETVSAHIDKQNVNARKALGRLTSLLQERLIAYGERWKKWCDTRTHTSQKNTIPLKYQERGVISQDPMGNYTINPRIRAWELNI